MRTGYDLKAACAAIGEQSSYPDVAEWADYFLHVKASDAGALAGDGYIHLVAVRDDARALGLGRQLYERFAAVAAQRGAAALKAITSPENRGSIAFHRRMGFTEMTLDPDYQGSGRARVVMRRPHQPPRALRERRKRHAGLRLPARRMLPLSTLIGRLGVV